MDSIKEKLKSRHAELTARLGRIETRLRHSDGEFPDDWTERATELQNAQALEAISHEERLELKHLTEALARIEAGTYGVCECCGTQIPTGRLAAMPSATRCTSCA
jgi:RNA polymerase-binding protein DksA